MQTNRRILALGRKGNLCLLEPILQSDKEGIFASFVQANLAFFNTLSVGAFCVISKASIEPEIVGLQAPQKFKFFELDDFQKPVEELLKYFEEISKSIGRKNLCIIYDESLYENALILFGNLCLYLDKTLSLDEFFSLFSNLDDTLKSNLKISIGKFKNYLNSKEYIRLKMGTASKRNPTSTLKKEEVKKIVPPIDPLVASLDLSSLEKSVDPDDTIDKSSIPIDFNLNSITDESQKSLFEPPPIVSSNTGKKIVLPSFPSSPEEIIKETVAEPESKEIIAEPKIKEIKEVKENKKEPTKPKNRVSNNKINDFINEQIKKEILKDITVQVPALNLNISEEISEPEPEVKKLESELVESNRFIDEILAESSIMQIDTLPMDETISDGSLQVELDKTRPQSIKEIIEKVDPGKTARQERIEIDFNKIIEKEIEDDLLNDLEVAVEKTKSSPKISAIDKPKKKMDVGPLETSKLDSLIGDELGAQFGFEEEKKSDKLKPNESDEFQVTEFDASKAEEQFLKHANVLNIDSLIEDELEPESFFSSSDLNLDPPTMNIDNVIQEAITGESNVVDMEMDMQLESIVLSGAKEILPETTEPKEEPGEVPNEEKKEGFPEINDVPPFKAIILD